MTYVIQNAGLAGGQPIAEITTIQRHPLGMLAVGIDPVYGVGEFIYLIGVASTAVGSWVTFTEDDFATALLAADAVGRVAVAMGANVASSYGWYQIKGKAVGKALTGYLDNADVYATATAGSVDDAVVIGDVVLSARGASAVDTPSTGLAEFEIDRPYTTNGKLFDSTALTSTTAELNIMTGVTATANQINVLATVTATAVQLNEYTIVRTIIDASAEASYYIVAPHAGTINKIYVVTDSAVLTADVTVTSKIATVGVTNGVVTCPVAGAAAGNVAVATPTAARTVTAGQAIELLVSGGGSAGTGPRLGVSILIGR